MYQRWYFLTKRFIYLHLITNLFLLILLNILRESYIYELSDREVLIFNSRSLILKKFIQLTTKQVCSIILENTGFNRVVSNALMIFYNISKGANMTFRTEASLASKILKFSSILMMTLLISDMSAKHMNKCSLQMTGGLLSTSRSMYVVAKKKLYSLVTLTLVILKVCAQSTPPCMRKPHGAPPSSTNRRAVMGVAKLASSRWATAN